MKKYLPLWTTPLLCQAGLIAVPSAAQSQILAAPGETGTTVTQTGDRFDITGGTQAGGNLFHEFEELSVNNGQTANFLSDSGVFNVVGRVSGGHPSYIDGRVQVSGSNANLYLVNPSGVLFGPNGQLSLQGSFTATTADQMGFGNGWLKASDRNVDYSALAADPSALRFTADSSDTGTSAVVNQGDLAVAPGKSILLVGGSVVSTGSLSAPGGEVGLVAVGGRTGSQTGSQTVRLRVPGSLLSLEVASTVATNGIGASEESAFQSTDLPALITGSPVRGANTLIVNDDGSVTLGSNVIEEGSVAVSGSVSTRSAEAAGGTVALLGKSVNVVNAVIDASGVEGGTVRIGGDYRGQGTLPTAGRTQLDADSIVRADGEVAAGGNIVVWADDEAFVQGTISAVGKTQGGFVETSARYLNTDGIRVNASGNTGSGKWLVDPIDVEIVSGAAGTNQISSSTIESALNGGTDFEVITGGGTGGSGDISLLTSITQSATSAANLTFTGRRFEDNAHKINLAGSGQLTFNINAVNPEARTDSSSIESAISAIGDVAGDRLLQIGAGTYDFADAAAINTRLKIQGAGTSDTTFITSSNNRILSVLSGGGVLVQGVTFTTEGLGANVPGGGINNAGTLTVLDSSFADNRSASFGFGGAIDSQSGSKLAINNSTFQNNSAFMGGAIALGEASTATIEGSVFANNAAMQEGGGIYATNADLSLANSFITGNQAGLSGGGLLQNSGVLNIANVQLRNNLSDGDGGGAAIRGDGRLVVVDTTVEDNSSVSGYGGGLSVGGSVSAQVTGKLTTDADGKSVAASTLFQNNTAGQDGGGIAALDNSRLTIDGVLFRGNVAGDDGGGIGAVETGEAAIAINNSNFENNRATDKGGGLYRNNALEATLPEINTIAVTNSRFIENEATDHGGGFFLGVASGSAVIQESLFRANSALNGGGGLYSAGTTTLQNSELINNTAGSLGGGAQVNINASLMATGTTFAGNRATKGGGIANQGTVELVNTTLSGNAAAEEGGAIYAFDPIGDLTLRSSTVSNNSAGQIGGGIATANNQLARLSNTIVAANKSATASDVSGAFVDQGDNLIGDANGSTGFFNSLLVGTAAAPLDAKLMPLANNGGPTKTHLLQADSPAINAVRGNISPATDQRGVNRPTGAAADIGAVELAEGEIPAEIINAIAPNNPFPPINPAAPSLPTNPSISPAVLNLSANPNIPISKLDTLLANNPHLKPSLTKVGGTDSAVLLSQASNDTQKSADNNAVRRLEQTFRQSFEDYWDLSLGPDLNFDEIQAILRHAQAEYKVNSAVIYATFTSPEESPEANEDNSSNILQIESAPAEDDLLNLALVMPEGELVRYQLPVTRREANQQVRLFRSNVSDPEDSFGYRPLAQQLYQWLLAPLEKDLAAQGIQNLMYALDTGLRTAPITAMRDNNGFALERYGISVVPSMGLMQADFPVPVRRSTVAMGVAEFESESALPAVPIELQVVQNFVPAAHTVLNEGTTTHAIRSVQALEQPGTLHLATHATFDTYSPESSSIQLWKDSLSMAEFATLDWRGSDLDLLVLSACSTALSSPNAELGFAGLAAAAGVDATVGSLWQVSDIGTLALMSEFYARLESNELRFEALRHAQLALLSGETRIENGSLITSKGKVALPEEWGLPPSATLDHPFFWSAFTMVGNPW